MTWPFEDHALARWQQALAEVILSFITKGTAPLALPVW